MFHPIVGEEFVYFVADQGYPLFEKDAAYRFQLFLRVYDSRRVVRRIKEQYLRLPPADLFLKHPDGHLVPCIRAGLDDPRHCPDELGHLRITDPVGSDEHHFVARVGERIEGVEYRVLRPMRDDDLFPAVINAEKGRILLGNRLAKLLDPGRRGVARTPLPDGLDAGLLDHVRRLKVGLAGGESHNVLARFLQCVGPSIQAESYRRFDAGRPLADVS
jgi:hypothetical protein